MQDETVYKAQTKGMAKGNSMLPLLLVGGGILLLLPRLLPGAVWAPSFFLVVPGLLLLWPSHQSTAEQRSSLSFLAIPGAVLLVTGLLLLVMGVTGHYGSWAYLWPLLPAAIVGGIRYMKRFEPDHTIHRSGYRVIRALILVTMVLAVSFEVFIFRGMGAWWPLLLIGIGVYLWLRQERS